MALNTITQKPQPVTWVYIYRPKSHNPWRGCLYITPKATTRDVGVYISPNHIAKWEVMVLILCYKIIHFSVNGTLLYYLSNLSLFYWNKRMQCLSRKDYQYCKLETEQMRFRIFELSCFFIPMMTVWTMIKVILKILNYYCLNRSH